MQALKWHGDLAEPVRQHLLPNHTITTINVANINFLWIVFTLSVPFHKNLNSSQFNSLTISFEAGKSEEI